MSIAVLRQMFEQMVEKKDPAAIDRFYDPSFVMSSNGITQDFDAFAASHRTTPDLLLRRVRRTGLDRNDRQGRRPGMDYDQPPRREPHPHRSRVDRRL